MGIRNKDSGPHEGKAPHEDKKPRRKSHKGEVDEGVVPIRGDEKLADELAMKAYGDKDHDGKPDVPNVPFPD